jgi:hypothetical protein
MLALVAGTITPAQAEVLRDPPPTCVYAPGSYFQFNDAFHCQVPPPSFGFTIYPSDLNICFIATGFTDAAHPYPNGWGNAVSSLKNITAYKFQAFDAASCGGPVLFDMAPYTMRPTLVAAANNKLSAFRWVAP